MILVFNIFKQSGKKDATRAYIYIIYKAQKGKKGEKGKKATKQQGNKVIR